MNEQPKPDWWPECPWPEGRGIWPDTLTAQTIRKLKREVWEQCEKEIWERLKEALPEITESTVTGMLPNNKAGHLASRIQ